MTTKFNKATVRALRKELEKAVIDIEKRHDIKISFGTIRFGDDEFRCKLTANSGSAAASVSTGVDPKWITAFHRNGFKFGLSSKDLGQEITVRGTKFTIVGLRPRATFKVVGQRVGSRSGRLTPLDHMEVVKALGR